MNKIKILLLGLVIVLTQNLSAAEIVIGPPPIIYVPQDTNQSESLILSTGYVGFEADSIDLTGYSLGLSAKTNYADKSFLYVNGTLMLMEGDGTDYTYSQFTYDASIKYGKNISDLSIFAGIGVNLSTSTIEFTSANINDITIYTNIINAVAGVQYSLKTPFGAFLPWATYTTILGGETKIGIDSVDIEPFAYTQYGFDFYFDSIAMSLSSMYQSTDSGDLVSFTLNFTL